jgi:hypothetical protein
LASGSNSPHKVRVLPKISGYPPAIAIAKRRKSPKNTNFLKVFDIQAKNFKKAPMVLYILKSCKICRSLNGNGQKCRYHALVATLPGLSEEKLIGKGIFTNIFKID